MTLLLLSLIAAVPHPADAQGVMDASPAATRANHHYANGWNYIRSESWSDAVH